MLSMLMHSSSKDVFQAAAHALSTLLEQNGKGNTVFFNKEEQRYVVFL
jgi:leucine-rich repeat kinase 2